MSQTISRTGRTPGPRPVTGYTVLAWMVGFFAVIFAANGVFIYLAAGCFPGLEVSSAYKAGQEYNGEIAAAAAQSARGWNVSASAHRAGDGAALSVVLADSAGAPETHLAVSARLEHPTDTHHDREATLVETAPGTYTADVAGVAPGRWWLVIDAVADGQRLFRSRNSVFLAK